MRSTIAWAITIALGLVMAVPAARAQDVVYLKNGSVIRGIEYTVGLTEAAFTDIGDLHLFGEILKEFLSNYVTINSFLQLVFVLRPSGTRLRWDTIEGKRWPI